ncbi:chemokine XC receptor 1-like [Engraulis encrasicolus]|uniref:chemokine XC receptor 1-like n=1 Tax=Engraulis encrasicolus TaxID=184585 RepID=UPI002FD5A7F8
MVNYPLKPGYIQESFRKEMENTTNFNYVTDYESDDCDKSNVVKFGAIATPVVFCVVTFLSLIGNLLVIIILLKYENLKSITNCFIFNLALSDLMFTFGLPFWAYYNSYQWLLGDFTCKAVNFVFYTGFYSSLLFLTVMTIQRYRAVVYPLSDRGEKRTCFALCLSVCIWVVSLAAALLSTLRSKVQKHYNIFYCHYDNIVWKRNAAYQQNAFFFLAFGIMCFCYSRILKTVLKSPTSKRIRTVKLIFVIVVVFVLGWAPYNIRRSVCSLGDIVIFLKTFAHLPPLNECNVSINLDYAYYVSECVAYSHCCLNPVFYAFVGVKFRKHLTVIFQKIPRPPQASVEFQRTKMIVMPSQGSMY